MARRLMVRELFAGDVPLEAAAAHHARDVLRLEAGDEVELFTPDGQQAAATLVEVSSHGVVAKVLAVKSARRAFALTVASAVPKGPRADWMVEKLSELGVFRLVPLLTQRSVVHPAGSGKAQRWDRIAAEASRQSGRADVMRIEPLTPLARFLDATAAPARAYLSTGLEAVGIASWLAEPAQRDADAMSLLIGPEGGWAPAELEMFAGRHLTGLALGATILRVETAAIAAATVVAVHRGSA